MILIGDIRRFVEQEDFLGLLHWLGDREIPTYEADVPNGDFLFQTVCDLYLLLTECIVDDIPVQKHLVELDGQGFSFAEAVMHHAERIADAQLYHYLELKPTVGEINDSVRVRERVGRAGVTRKHHTSEKHDAIRKIAGRLRLATVKSKATHIKNNWATFPELDGDPLSISQLRSIIANKK